VLLPAYVPHLYEIVAGLSLVFEKSKSLRIFINRSGFAADIPW